MLADWELAPVLGYRADRGGGGCCRQRSTQYRVQLSNLPPRMTWMELKEFLRGGGDVVQADVDRRGGGTASFATYHEMKSAIRTLDRHELEGECVRVREDRFPAAESRNSSAGSTSGNRSPPRSYARARSRSRSRSRSSSVSRSPRDRPHSRTSRRVARSPSRSRSRSRSPSPRRYSRRRSRSRSRSR